MLLEVIYDTTGLHLFERVGVVVKKGPLLYAHEILGASGSGKVAWTPRYLLMAFSDGRASLLQGKGFSIPCDNPECGCRALYRSAQDAHRVGLLCILHQVRPKDATVVHLSGGYSNPPPTVARDPDSEGLFLLPHHLVGMGTDAKPSPQYKEPRATVGLHAAFQDERLQPIRSRRQLVSVGNQH